MISRALDLNHPFFIPLWRRIATVAVAAIWAVVEFATGTPFFGVLFAAIAAWCTYGFFFTFDPQDPAP